MLAHYDEKDECVYLSIPLAIQPDGMPDKCLACDVVKIEIGPARSERVGQYLAMIAKALRAYPPQP